MEIPSGHQTVMPYLIIAGAAGFIAFCQKVFHARLTAHHLQEGSDRVQHAELQLGNSTLMLSDASEQWKPQTANLFVYVADADATHRQALKQGATTLMELSNKDYGRTCGVTDPYGNVWWITAILKQHLQPRS
ncbi:VOC family protein [Cesiribacter andamanensis]|uniref:Putative enzyme n=1 Tax=Cesiribacter andamanensis AMV16 TaxID=1279009 RepID=M7NXB7_9BACT|nr:VOC family protein [Cesiribacter andamanensis]EMR03079.1 putative enzyme [Cesiribacter andamanensis AMV16]